jgi:hypothetical protein
VSSRAKAKGTRWESDIVRYLNVLWGETTLEAQRLVQTGVADQGDIKVGRFILQARDRAQIDLSGSVDDARIQLANYRKVHPGTDAQYSAAVIKRRRRDTAGGYVVMTLGEFVGLLGELR